MVSPFSYVAVMSCTRCVQSTLRSTRWPLRTLFTTATGYLCGCSACQELHAVPAGVYFELDRLPGDSVWEEGVPSRDSSPHRHSYGSLLLVTMSGTVRRHLEHFGRTVGKVVFCVDRSEDYELYQKVMTLYLPRTLSEQMLAKEQLPKDTGEISALLLTFQGTSLVNLWKRAGRSG